MSKFNAVKFMRQARDKLMKRYERLSVEERVIQMRKDLEGDPFWKDFLKRRRKVTS